MPKPVTSSDITERFLELIYSGKISFDDQLKTFKFLSEMFGLKTISNQARQENVSPSAIYQSKRKFLQIDNVKFILNCD
jgi:hypothetical protein